MYYFDCRIEMDARNTLDHHGAMKHALSALFVLLSAPMASDAQTFTLSTPSTITMTHKRADSWVTHQRAVRYETYGHLPDDIHVGVTFAQRLAAIAEITDVRDDDETSRTEVIVYDVSGRRPRRVISFSDVGRDGKLSSQMYFITQTEGCCALPVRYIVHNIDTGKWLFNASGAGEVGMAAWMEQPNHHPSVERWAAFEGAPVGDSDPARLGYLRYGDRYSALMTFEVRMDPAKQPEEFQLDLPSCGALLWREPGKAPSQNQKQRPAEDECFQGGAPSPVGLFSLEHQTGPLGGFELELSLFGKVYAIIPVNDDRLDIANAKLEPGITLTAKAATFRK